MAGSVDDEPPDAWEDAPTVSDEARARLDTPTRDLSSLARVSAPAGRDDAIALAHNEGIEEAIRALYAVMRQSPMTAAEAHALDALVMAMRREIVRL